MRNSLFHVERMEMTTLQTQIREMLVSAMLSGQLPVGAPIPSTRAMAKRLKVSRNTVMLAYQALASDGYLVARERSGFYVSPEIHDGTISGVNSTPAPEPDRPEMDWDSRFRVQPSGQSNIVKAVELDGLPLPLRLRSSRCSAVPDCCLAGLHAPGLWAANGWTHGPVTILPKTIAC